MKIKSEYIYKILATLLIAAFIPLANSESLWPKNRVRATVGDKVSIQRGDLLTVIISQSTSLSTSLDSSNENTANINNAVTQWLFPVDKSGFGTHNGAAPGTIIDGKNKNQRKGASTASTALTDRIQIMVSDVLPNGNLILTGTRSVEYDNEVVHVTLSGICRLWDVSAANTIQSSLISQFDLKYEFEGELTEGQKKGWLQKVYDRIKPF
jgi:flagellar L-ring protein FlgH